MAIRAERSAHPAQARFCEPLTGLYAAAAGSLYGTTFAGGSANAGTVNNLAPDDTETVLHALNGSGEGAPPGSMLVADKEGNLCGTPVERTQYAGGMLFGVKE
jgi:uncharacterized repeat protein (TIGR03803 family)